MLTDATARKREKTTDISGLKPVVWTGGAKTGCVSEREREKQREPEREIERLQGMAERHVCVCVRGDKSVHECALVSLHPSPLTAALSSHCSPLLSLHSSPLTAALSSHHCSPLLSLQPSPTLFSPCSPPLSPPPSPYTARHQQYSFHLLHLHTPFI